KGGDHEVGCSIHHLGSIEEVRRGIDESAEPDHPHDLVEIAEGGLDLGQDIDGRDAGGPLTVLHRYPGPKLPLRHQLALGIETELTRYDEQVPGAHEADIICDWRGRRRQNNAKISKFTFHHFGHESLRQSVLSRTVPGRATVRLIQSWPIERPCASGRVVAALGRRPYVATKRVLRRSSKCAVPTPPPS